MKAMVLTAGCGTRLGALTQERPKPMLDVGGMPLLERILRHHYTCGVRQVVLNLHYLPDVIRSHFGSGEALGLAITYSVEPMLLGTAGALRHAAARLREGPFLVQYGDVLCTQDIGPLFERHRAKGALATILVHRRPGSNSVVTVADDGRVTGFWERPTEPPPASEADRWVFSGLCVLSPDLLDLIPDGVVWDLPRDVFTPLVSSGRLQAVPLGAFRLAVDSPERLAQARIAAVQGQLSSGGLHV